MIRDFGTKQNISAFPAGSVRIGNGAELGSDTTNPIPWDLSSENFL